MRLQCLSHAWEIIFWSPIGDFAEYLLVSSTSYQIQNYHKLQKFYQNY